MLMGITVEIPLTLGQAALVDAADAPALLAIGKWHAHASRGTFYACRRRDGRVERMHSYLTGWSLVDHINGDGLDNRRSNLRPATSAENAWNRCLSSNNTSGFKGVSWHRQREAWSAYISIDGRRRYLGNHATAEAAALAYDEAARELYGRFARLNFTDGAR